MLETTILKLFFFFEKLKGIDDPWGGSLQVCKETYAV